MKMLPQNQAYRPPSGVDLVADRPARSQFDPSRRFAAHCERFIRH